MPIINKKQLNPNNINNINKTNNEKELAQLYCYNTECWTKLRQIKLKNNPICERCLNLHNIITPTTQIHHIQPFMTGLNIEQIKSLAFDYNNLMSLCDECHKAIHNNKEKKNDKK